MNLLYEGLLPGRSVAEAIIERRLRNPASFCALRHWRVAEDAQGSLLGGLNSLPNVELAKSVSDPAIGPDRLDRSPSCSSSTRSWSIPTTST
jgi:hypothetical protein